MKTQQVTFSTTETQHVYGHGDALMGAINMSKSIAGGTLRTDETVAMAFVLPARHSGGRRAKTKTFKGTGDKVFRRALHWIEKQVEMMEAAERI